MNRRGTCLGTVAARFAGMVAACAVAASADAQPDAPGADTPAHPAPAPAAAPVHPDLVVLQDGAAEAAARNAAAVRVLTSNDPQLRLAAVALLAPGMQPVDAQRILLERAGEMANAPSWLVGPCRALLEDEATPAALRANAITALGSVRTRDAVRVLLPWIDSTARPELREPAARALGRLTGRTELGSDARQWRTWFATVEWLPDLEWRTHLAQGLAEAADRAARDRDRSTALLIDALRDGFQDAQTQEQRSAMLVQFLQHELGPVRRLGVQLARQELANARALDSSVAKAAEGLLSDPSREFRRSAAELLAILPRTDSGDAVATALIREEDPEVAAPLLRAAARNPTPAMASAVMRWVEGPESCRGFALNAAAALYADGDLSDPQAFIILRRALRDARLSDLSPGPNGTLALYYALGGATERARVRALLADADPVRRRSAADLLGSDPDAVDALLSAAANDPQLFRPAVRAVAAHRSDFDGYTAVAGLPAASAADQREGLLEVAAALPPSDLLAAALGTEELTFRESLLARLTATEELQANGVWRMPAQTPQPAVVAGLLLLCRTRLELGRPAAAWEVLADLEPVAMLIEPGEREHLRTVTLLWLNRLEEAAQANGTATDWLDGLQRSIALPHATSIVRALESRFPDLNGEAAARLARLRNQIANGG